MSTPEQKKLYDKTKNFLEVEFNKLQVIIGLINSIKHPTRQYTLQEVLDISEEIRKLNNGSLDQSKESLSLMLRVKSESRRDKGVQYTPLIIETGDEYNKKSDATLFAEYLADLPAQAKFHYDVILRSKYNGHATPIIIDSFGNEKILIFADAAGDPANHNTIDMIAMALGAKIYKNELIGTQKDSVNCTVFSLQDLTQMSKMPIDQLKSSFPEDPNQKHIKIHPQFIKNSQSEGLLTDYKEMFQEKDIMLNNEKTLNDYLDEYSVKLEFSNSDGRVLEYTKNYSILFKKFKYLEKSLSLLESLTPEEFKRIYDETNGNNLLFYKKVLNPIQIELMTIYKLHMDIGIIYPCFVDDNVSEKVFEFITDGINPDSMTDDDKIILRERFQKVKNLRSLDQLEAVTKYDLPEKYAFSSFFFNDPKNTLELVKWAYNTGGKEKLEEVFKKIDRAGYDAYNMKNNVDYKIDRYELFMTCIDSWGYNSDVALNYIQNAAEKGESAAREVLNKLKELNNQYQFKAVLDFNLNSEEVKNARCFSNNSLIANQVFELMEEERNNNIQGSSVNIFNKVKNLVNTYQLDVVQNCGLNPDDVSNALCFNNIINNNTIIETALYSIKEAHKKGNAEEMFNKIKDFSNLDECNIALKYNLDPQKVGNMSFMNRYGKKEILSLLDKEYKTKGAEVFYLLKDVSSYNAAKLVLIYGLDPKEVNDINYEDSYIKYIDDIYNTQGQEQVAIVFKKISKLKTREQIEAVLTYGLDEYEVSKARCFYNSFGDNVSAKKALELFSENKESVKSIFNTIKDCYEHNLFKKRVEYSRYVSSPVVYTDLTEENRYSKRSTINPEVKKIYDSVLKDIKSDKSNKYNSPNQAGKSIEKVFEEKRKVYDNKKKYTDMLTEIKDKKVESSSNIVGNLLNNKKDPKKEVQQILDTIPEDIRPAVVAEALDEIGNTFKRDRLLSFLSEKDQENINRKVNHTLYEIIRDFVSHISPYQYTSEITQEDKTHNNKKGNCR